MASPPAVVHSPRVHNQHPGVEALVARARNVGRIVAGQPPPPLRASSEAFYLDPPTRSLGKEKKLWHHCCCIGCELQATTLLVSQSSVGVLQCYDDDGDGGAGPPTPYASAAVGALPRCPLSLLHGSTVVSLQTAQVGGLVAHRGAHSYNEVQSEWRGGAAQHCVQEAVGDGGWQRATPTADHHRHHRHQLQ